MALETDSAQGLQFSGSLNLVCGYLIHAWIRNQIIITKPVPTKKNLDICSCLKWDLEPLVHVWAVTENTCLPQTTWSLWSFMTGWLVLLYALLVILNCFSVLVIIPPDSIKEIFAHVLLHTGHAFPSAHQCSMMLWQDAHQHLYRPLPLDNVKYWEEVTQQDLLSQSNLAASLAFQPHLEALAPLLGSGQLQHLPHLSVPKLQ